MNKFMLFILGVALFIVSCNIVIRPTACPQDAKICPDGSTVGRVPPNCEFATCSEVKTNTSCVYDSLEKTYVGKSKDECSRIRFLCERSREYFEDECGCGCKLKERAEESKKNYCTPEQKKAEVCIQLYQPVCGWFDPEKIQCIKYPCAQTFSNSCFACIDDKVLYWTEGECPE